MFKVNFLDKFKVKIGNFWKKNLFFGRILSSISKLFFFICEKMKKIISFRLFVVYLLFFLCCWTYVYIFNFWFFSYLTAYVGDFLYFSSNSKSPLYLWFFNFITNSLKWFSYSLNFNCFNMWVLSFFLFIGSFFKLLVLDLNFTIALKVLNSCDLLSLSTYYWQLFKLTVTNLGDYQFFIFNKLLRYLIDVVSVFKTLNLLQGILAYLFSFLIMVLYYLHHLSVNLLTGVVIFFIYNYVQICLFAKNCFIFIYAKTAYTHDLLLKLIEFSELLGIRSIWATSAVTGIYPLLYKLSHSGGVISAIAVLKLTLTIFIFFSPFFILLSLYRNFKTAKLSTWLVYLFNPSINFDTGSENFEEADLVIGAERPRPSAKKPVSLKRIFSRVSLLVLASLKKKPVGDGLHPLTEPPLPLIGSDYTSSVTYEPELSFFQGKNSKGSSLSNFSNIFVSKEAEALNTQISRLSLVAYLLLFSLFIHFLHYEAYYTCWFFVNLDNYYEFTGLGSTPISQNGKLPYYGQPPQFSYFYRQVNPLILESNTLLNKIILASMVEKPSVLADFLSIDHTNLPENPSLLFNQAESLSSTLFSKFGDTLKKNTTTQHNAIAELKELLYHGIISFKRIRPDSFFLYSHNWMLINRNALILDTLKDPSLSDLLVTLYYECFSERFSSFFKYLGVFTKQIVPNKHKLFKPLIQNQIKLFKFLNFPKGFFFLPYNYLGTGSCSMRENSYNYNYLTTLATTNYVDLRDITHTTFTYNLVGLGNYSAKQKFANDQQIYLTVNRQFEDFSFVQLSEFDFSSTFFATALRGFKHDQFFDTAFLNSNFLRKPRYPYLFVDGIKFSGNKNSNLLYSSLKKIEDLGFKLPTLSFMSKTSYGLYTDSMFQDFILLSYLLKSSALDKRITSNKSLIQTRTINDEGIGYAGGHKNYLVKKSILPTGSATLNQSERLARSEQNRFLEKRYSYLYFLRTLYDYYVSRFGHTIGSFTFMQPGYSLSNLLNAMGFILNHHSVLKKEYPTIFSSIRHQNNKSFANYLQPVWFCFLWLKNNPWYYLYTTSHWDSCFKFDRNPFNRKIALNFRPGIENFYTSFRISPADYLFSKNNNSTRLGYSSNLEFLSLLNNKNCNYRLRKACSPVLIFKKPCWIDKAALGQSTFKSFFRTNGVNYFKKNHLFKAVPINKWKSGAFPLPSNQFYTDFTQNDLLGVDHGISPSGIKNTTNPVSSVKSQSIYVSYFSNFLSSETKESLYPDSLNNYSINYSFCASILDKLFKRRSVGFFELNSIRGYSLYTLNHRLYKVKDYFDSKSQIREQSSREIPTLTEEMKLRPFEKCSKIRPLYTYHPFKDASLYGDLKLPQKKKVLNRYIHNLSKNFFFLNTENFFLNKALLENKTFITEEVPYFFLYNGIIDFYFKIREGYVRYSIPKAPLILPTHFYQPSIIYNYYYAPFSKLFLAPPIELIPESLTQLTGYFPMYNAFTSKGSSFFTNWFNKLVSLWGYPVTSSDNDIVINNFGIFRSLNNTTPVPGSKDFLNSFFWYFKPVYNTNFKKSRAYSIPRAAHPSFMFLGREATDNLKVSNLSGKFPTHIGALEKVSNSTTIAYAYRKRWLGRKTYFFNANNAVLNPYSSFQRKETSGKNLRKFNFIYKLVSANSHLYNNGGSYVAPTIYTPTGNLQENLINNVRSTPTLLIDYMGSRSGRFIRQLMFKHQSIVNYDFSRGIKKDFKQSLGLLAKPQPIYPFNNLNDRGCFYQYRFQALDPAKKNYAPYILSYKLIGFQSLFNFCNGLVSKQKINSYASQFLFKTCANFLTFINYSGVTVCKPSSFLINILSFHKENLLLGLLKSPTTYTIKKRFLLKQNTLLNNFNWFETLKKIKHYNDFRQSYLRYFKLTGKFPSLKSVQAFTSAPSNYKLPDKLSKGTTFDLLSAEHFGRDYSFSRKFRESRKKTVDSADTSELYSNKEPPLDLWANLFTPNAVSSLAELKLDQSNPLKKISYALLPTKVGFRLLNSQVEIGSSLWVHPVVWNFWNWNNFQRTDIGVFNLNSTFLDYHLKESACKDVLSFFFTCKKNVCLKQDIYGGFNAFGFLHKQLQFQKINKDLASHKVLPAHSTYISNSTYLKTLNRLSYVEENGEVKFNRYIGINSWSPANEPFFPQWVVNTEPFNISYRNLGLGCEEWWLALEAAVHKLKKEINWLDLHLGSTNPNILKQRLTAELDDSFSSLELFIKLQSHVGLFDFLVLSDKIKKFLKKMVLIKSILLNSTSKVSTVTVEDPINNKKNVYLAYGCLTEGFNEVLSLQQSSLPAPVNATSTTFTDLKKIPPGYRISFDKLNQLLLGFFGNKILSTFTFKSGLLFDIPHFKPYKKTFFIDKDLSGLDVKDLTEGFFGLKSVYPTRPSYFLNSIANSLEIFGLNTTINLLTYKDLIYTRNLPQSSSTTKQTRVSRFLNRDPFLVKNVVLETNELSNFHMTAFKWLTEPFNNFSVVNWQPIFFFFDSNFAYKLHKLTPPGLSDFFQFNLKILNKSWYPKRSLGFLEKVSSSWQNNILESTSVDEELTAVEPEDTKEETLPSIPVDYYVDYPSTNNFISQPLTRFFYMPYQSTLKNSFTLHLGPKKSFLLWQDSKLNYKKSYVNGFVVKSFTPFVFLNLESLGTFITSNNPETQFSFIDFNLALLIFNTVSNNILNFFIDFSLLNGLSIAEIFTSFFTFYKSFLVFDFYRDYTFFIKYLHYSYGFSNLKDFAGILDSKEFIFKIDVNKLPLASIYTLFRCILKDLNIFIFNNSIDSEQFFYFFESVRVKQHFFLFNHLPVNNLNHLILNSVLFIIKKLEISCVDTLIKDKASRIIVNLTFKNISLQNFLESNLFVRHGIVTKKRIKNLFLLNKSTQNNFILKNLSDLDFFYSRYGTRSYLFNPTGVYSFQKLPALGKDLPPRLPTMVEHNESDLVADRSLIDLRYPVFSTSQTADILRNLNKIPRVAQVSSSSVAGKGRILESILDSWATEDTPGLLKLAKLFDYFPDSFWYLPAFPRHNFKEILFLTLDINETFPEVSDYRDFFMGFFPNSKKNVILKELIANSFFSDYKKTWLLRETWARDISSSDRNLLTEIITDSKDYSAVPLWLRTHLILKKPGVSTPYFFEPKPTHFFKLRVPPVRRKSVYRTSDFFEPLAPFYTAKLFRFTRAQKMRISLKELRRPPSIRFTDLTLSFQGTDWSINSPTYQNFSKTEYTVYFESFFNKYSKFLLNLEETTSTKLKQITESAQDLVFVRQPILSNLSKLLTKNYLMKRILACNDYTVESTKYLVLLNKTGSTSLNATKQELNKMSDSSTGSFVSLLDNHSLTNKVKVTSIFDFTSLYWRKVCSKSSFNLKPLFGIFFKTFLKEPYIHEDLSYSSTLLEEYANHLYSKKFGKQLRTLPKAFVLTRDTRLGFNNLFFSFYFLNNFNNWSRTANSKDTKLVNFYLSNLDNGGKNPFLSLAAFKFGAFSTRQLKNSFFWSDSFNFFSFLKKDKTTGFSTDFYNFLSQYFFSVYRKEAFSFNQPGTKPLKYINPVKNFWPTSYKYKLKAYLNLYGIQRLQDLQSFSEGRWRFLTSKIGYYNIAENKHPYNELTYLSARPLFFSKSFASFSIFSVYEFDFFLKSWESSSSYLNNLSTFEYHAALWLLRPWDYWTSPVIGSKFMCLRK